ncbi:MAG: hypothetical protein AAF686_07000 [Pseudomonadota bacterium]
MKRWAQNPPSERRVIFILSIVGLCLLLFALERFVGLPDWMQLAPRGMRWQPE